MLLHYGFYPAYLLIYARTWLAANLGVFLKWMSTEFWSLSMAWAKHQVHKMSEARCHGVKSTSDQPSVCNPFFHQHEIQAGPTPQASLAKHVPRCFEQYSLFRTISQNLKLCEPLQTWADAHEIQLALLLDVSVGCIVYKHVWALFSRWRSGHDLWAFGHLCTVQLDSHRYLRWYQARWLNALFDEALPSCWGCLLRRGQTTHEAMKKTGLWPCIPTSAPTSHTIYIVSILQYDWSAQIHQRLNRSGLPNFIFLSQRLKQPQPSNHAGKTWDQVVRKKAKTTKYVVATIRSCQRARVAERLKQLVGLRSSPQSMPCRKQTWY